MSGRFTIEPTPLAGVFTVARRPRCDDRGFLERLFCEHDLAPLLPPGRRIVQVNRSLTRGAGTVRGMHFQRPPHAELKVVTCLRGSVFDVAVDVRADSPTRLMWHGVVLSADRHEALVIPEGFAHGFQTLTTDCELLYFHTAAWSPDAEAGLNPLDPAVGIRWPQPITGLSDRDRRHPLLATTDEACPVRQEAA